MNKETEEQKELITEKENKDDCLNLGYGLGAFVMVCDD